MVPWAAKDKTKRGNYGQKGFACDCPGTTMTPVSSLLEDDELIDLR